MRTVARPVSRDASSSRSLARFDIGEVPAPSSEVPEGSGITEKALAERPLALPPLSGADAGRGGRR